MWLSRAVYRIILQEVLARWQVARVQREAQIPRTLLSFSLPAFFLFSFLFKNYSKPQTHVRLRGTGNSCHYLARFLHVSPVRALHFSSGGFPYSLCLRCLCFYDHSSDPSPPLLLTQLRCITQAVVVALYLAPASRLAVLAGSLADADAQGTAAGPRVWVNDERDLCKKLLLRPPRVQLSLIKPKAGFVFLERPNANLAVDCWCCMVGSRFIWHYLWDKF